MAVTLGASVRCTMAFVMSLMFAIASAQPAGGPPAAGSPQTPSNDPFYQPPAGFESEKPGTILRQRTIHAGFYGLVPDPVEAYQLLYRTTAINGSAIAEVTTIFKPTSPNTMTDRFISFQTAYDSSATICDPSYNYQLGAPPTDQIASAEQFIFQGYLLKGYIVASPDYEGPDAAFSPGHLEGMGVLDNMRAVSNFKDTLGLTTDSPAIVGTGYSGGAIATGWAASLHPSYAPELDIKGWAQGGTPANLTGTLLWIDGTIWSGFIPAAVAGLAMPSAYGAEMAPLIKRILTPKGRAAMHYSRHHCAVADLISFPDMSLFSKQFQTMGRALLTDPIVSKVLHENVMAVKQDETPTAPLFVYHAKQDEVIPYSNATTMVESWCDYGADVKFTTYAHGGHATTEMIALPDVMNFVDSAFAGTTDSGCSRNTELANTLNPIALGVELEPVLNKLIELLVAAGPGDANIKVGLSAASVLQSI